MNRIKKINRNIIQFMMLILLFSSLYGCQEKNGREVEMLKIDTVMKTKEPVDLSSLSTSLKEDYEALEIKEKDHIKGNITLPLEGTYGSSISWSSSNTSIISDMEVVNKNYDNTPAGVVSREERDEQVILIARLCLNNEVVEKEFLVTVKGKVIKDALTDYVFAYFTGDGVGQESIYFSTSKDGFSYKELNYGKPILESSLGTKGLRDPFILRSHEGDKFYLIATDLCIAKDNDWWNAQTSGSTSIMIWESEDLVHWSEQRMVKVNSSTAGCTWAPEAFYDEMTGEYLVFWASRVGSDNYSKQRIYYAKTRDFYTFTEPMIWIDYPFSTIDTTVVEDDDVYYRFTKYEENSTILLERSDTLLGTWTKIESMTLEEQKGVEGPYCFLLNEEDRIDDKRWCLLLDNYGGGGYYLMVTDSLEIARFEKKRGYNLPKGKPRHGTVMAITTVEYEKLMEVYGNK